MKKTLYYFVIPLIIFTFLCFYRLDYYIMKPGSAYDVSEFVTVDNGNKDAEGSMSLMTVAIAPATPITYVFAYFNDYQEIYKEEQIRQKEEDDEEYNLRQHKLMTDSQFNALYIAFQKANLPFTVEFEGVTVLNVLEKGAADGNLKPGDEIVEINGKIIERSEELLQMISKMKSGDEVKLVINRDDQLLDQRITLKPIPGQEERVGLGVTFSESKSINTTPYVDVDADEIGGPSAGLMFTLEILNQLLADEDLTKGYRVAGTGEMNEDGSVGRIGGIDKKVVAADEDGMEIFFAPDDEITSEMLKGNSVIKSNYEVAVETAEKIGTEMKIVPVKTIDDALSYLKSLDEKDK